MVLPASICAIIPILRYLFNLTLRPSLIVAISSVRTIDPGSLIYKLRLLRTTLCLNNVKASAETKNNEINNELYIIMIVVVVVCYVYYK